MKANLRCAVLILGLFTSSDLRADGPDMWASLSSSRIPNRSPAGNRNDGLTIVVTMLNPSSKPMLFDVFDSFWIKISDAKKNGIKDDWNALGASVAPAMGDIIHLNPHTSYSRAYTLHLHDGVLSFVGGEGVHRFTLPKPGEYTIEAVFESDPTHPLIAEFENSNFQSQINEFYRGPFKLGRFKIRIGDLNKQPAER